MSLHTDEGIYQASKGRTKFPYSFRSGVKYILTFSILLWWLPTLGQMIAGYVGGRKTAGPWKGVAAAILPVALIFGVSYMSTNGVLTNEIHFVMAIPSMIAGYVASSVPILGPYVEFALQYLAAFVVALKLTFATGLNGYFVTIIFAYIGGVVGQQVKRELVIRTASPVVAMPAINRGAPISLTRDTMRKSKTWWGRHPEKLKEMQKIPVRTVAKKRTKAATPKKVAAKPKPQPKSTTKATSAKASRKNLGRKGYDKATVNKRLVEKALGRYQKR